MSNKMLCLSLRLTNIFNMSSHKYHTIDPLILETLNLNENRMNHILDILHGRTPPRPGQTYRKEIHRPTIREMSPKPTSDDDKNLPPILFSQRKQTQKRTERANKSIIVRPTHLQNPKPEPVPEKKPAQKTYRPSQVRTSRVESVKKRPNTLDMSQSRSKEREQRAQQLVKDYRNDSIKRVKSQQINPKDAYRLEIEKLVGDLTEVEHLQEWQAKMRRLKKRHRHLHTFDKQYYLRLNQNDMSILS